MPKAQWTSDSESSAASMAAEGRQGTNRRKVFFFFFSFFFSLVQTAPKLMIANHVKCVYVIYEINVYMHVYAAVSNNDRHSQLEIVLPGEQTSLSL